MPELKTGTEQGQNGVIPAPETPVKPPMRRVFPAGYFARLEHYWMQGVNAQELGFARVSPYYEDVEADIYWFAGFDGQSFQATLQLYLSQSESSHHEKSN